MKGFLNKATNWLGLYHDYISSLFFAVGCSVRLTWGSVSEDWNALFSVTEEARTEEASIKMYDAEARRLD